MQAQDFADLYDLEENFWWFAGMRAITAALLDEFCTASDWKILDAGCGAGFNLEWLRRYTRAENIYGLDYSADALSFCQKRGLDLLAQASATDLPFAGESFNLVTSFDVLVQLFGELADERAIGEMHRILKPGGIIFVRAAAFRWMRGEHDRAMNSQRRYSLNELSLKIEKQGFRILRATYANTFLFPVALLKRLVLQKIGIDNKGSDVKPLPPNLQWLNKIFTGSLLREAGYLKKSARRLPFGLSAICVAQKI